MNGNMVATRKSVNSPKEGHHITNYREILRLNSIGFNNTEIADACDCSRTTIISVLRQADAVGIRYPLPDNMSDRDLVHALYPSVSNTLTYQMPDYEQIHKEHQEKVSR